MFADIVNDMITKITKMAETTDSRDALDLLKERLTKLEVELCTLKLSNCYLKRTITEISSTCNQNYGSIYDLEKYAYKNNQYSRKENIEIVNLPESLGQHEPEGKILLILKDMGIKISSYEIAAIHRIGKRRIGQPRNVIIRFTNRKYAYQILAKPYNLSQAAKKYNYEKVYVISNLCPEFKKIFNRCYRLKKQGVLKNVFTRNGVVYITFPDDEYDIPIEHPSDLDDELSEIPSGVVSNGFL